MRYCHELDGARLLIKEGHAVALLFIVLMIHRLAK